ncbi:hypothetical protein Krac_1809 [Ktedonobacter racemifer DSM 44963]|uniref:Uncharacterized protein n=1 Tax=Ktedonobacter racemifer DSM 44963 TaxID=485913 RepID=D6U3B5_KTERA|nr:hypothetical protein Krac_1809 [Ktedonobacter racemifer DSM 44963]
MMILCDGYLYKMDTHGSSLTLSNWPFWLIGTSIALILGYQCILRCIIRPWQLARRCRYTVGKVVEVRRFPPRASGTISAIEFQTHSMPSLTVRITKRGELHGKYDICYDFCHPFTNYKLNTASFRRDSAYRHIVCGVFFHPPVTCNTNADHLQCLHFLACVLTTTREAEAKKGDRKPKRKAKRRI